MDSPSFPFLSTSNEDVTCGKSESTTTMRWLVFIFGADTEADESFVERGYHCVRAYGCAGCKPLYKNFGVKLVSSGMFPSLPPQLVVMLLPERVIGGLLSPRFCSFVHFYKWVILIRLLIALAGTPHRYSSRGRRRQLDGYMPMKGHE